MFRLIGTLIVFVGLSLGATQTAFAHGRVYKQYDSLHHYRVSVIRDDVMPRWLRHEKGFRGWYRYSTLRHNRHLQWWQLFEIYQWEEQYDSRRHHTAYKRHHNYDWYRRYWRDYDRNYRDKYHDNRRRYRHDDRHDNDRRRHRH